MEGYPLQSAVNAGLTGRCSETGPYAFRKKNSFLSDTYCMLECILRMQSCSILDHLVDAVVTKGAAVTAERQPGSYAHHRVLRMNSSINAMMVSGASS